MEKYKKFMDWDSYKAYGLDIIIIMSIAPKLCYRFMQSQRISARFHKKLATLFILFSKEMQRANKYQANFEKQQSSRTFITSYLSRPIINI